MATHAAACAASLRCSRPRHGSPSPAAIRAWRPTAALVAPCRRHRRRCQPGPAALHRVVATSEHWYDDEEEFDALTDAMRPKIVVLAAGGSGGGAVPDTAVDALRAYLQPLTLNQAFSSSAAMPFAQQLWAGRDKAPYFLKVRARAALDAAAAGDVWAELLQQNWRVELDAGLGGAVPESEALLLVCEPEAAQQLLAAAGAAAPGSLAPGSLTVLQVEGTQAGDPLDWRALGKRLLLAGVLPDGSATIAATLQQAAAPVH